MAIGCFSRLLNSAENSYSTMERECLALVYGVTTCRPYLQQQHFTAHTDHSALRLLITINDPSGILMRWRIRLSEYSFDVMYKKGAENFVADATCRLQMDSPTTHHEDNDIPCYSMESPYTWKR